MEQRKMACSYYCEMRFTYYQTSITDCERQRHYPSSKVSLHQVHESMEITIGRTLSLFVRYTGSIWKPVHHIAMIILLSNLF